MLVILDDGPRQVFTDPLDRIIARTVADIPGALAAVDRALEAGRHVAGWLSYELGYALEPRLAGRMPADAGPLLVLGVFRAPGGEAPPLRGRAYAGPLKPRWDGAAYQARFDRVKDYIAAGDIYQANLSLRARFDFFGDPRALYEELRARSGAAHCGFVEYLDDRTGSAHQVLSLSPELFFDLTGDGALTVRPMKGTSPRDGAAREADDRAAHRALGASEKDRAENLMIVDLIRNDLGRIAEPGSVAVRDLFAVETYPTLYAMVSTVTARKRADVDASDLLKALFPCGSITGAPKIRAMEILRELEAGPRGAYCGAVGHFAPPRDGQAFRARFNVAIRTLTVTGAVGELGLGGGVVQDSRADSEYAECLVKARFFERGRRPLALIETLRWDGRFARLDRHMARMQGSARSLGLAFSIQAARLALEYAVAAKTGPLRVRLTLDEQGIHDATAHALEPDPPHWRYGLSPDRVPSGDPLLRHKTSWRDLYDRPHPDLDEMVFLNERGEVTEGARSTIFVRRGDVLLTPPLDCGLLPGVLRAELLAQGKAREAVLTPGDLDGEVYFGNALRGLIPAIRG